MFHFDTDFKDRNSERYMLPKRIDGLCQVLMQNYVIKKECSAGDFEMAEGDYLFSELELNADWHPFKSGVSRFGEPDGWYWFRQTVTIPYEFSGNDIWFYVYPYDEEEIWYWGQPQIQLFVNGKCVCGLDNNHRKHLLVKGASGGESLSVYMKIYSDLKYFKRPMTLISKLQITRPEVMELYRDISVPLEAAGNMQTDSPARIKIVKELNRAVNLLSLDSEPESAEFKDSVKQASLYLKNNLYGTLRSDDEPTLWAMGHSHIDIAWQWTYHVSHNKAARTFATQLRLMENNPEYIFMASQAQLYKFIKEDEPGIYKQIKDRVLEGRWEPEGALWVETDTNLTSGESLVRQFLFGKRFFKNEFGKESKVCWLPDVFGYSAALPQIAKRSGVPYFYTTKIGWNEYNKFPFDTFMWRGIDGSSVLSHFGCVMEYNEKESDWMTTYNPSLSAEFVLGSWQRYQQKDLGNNILYDFGFGDGGGGPTQEMIDYGRRFEKGVPGCPTVKFASVSDFYRHLDEEVSANPMLPVWDGEMYLEYHRGTYTSQAANKRYNRKSEILYHDVENLCSADMVLNGTSYPQDEINRKWEDILLNQFHDVLPGSSIGKVYEDSTALYNGILRFGKEKTDMALANLAGRIHTDAPSLAVFNTTSFNRNAVVTVDEELFGLMDANVPIPVQPTFDGKFVFIAPELPQKGWKVFEKSEASLFENGMGITESSIETDMLSVKFDDKMHISSLINKVSGRENVPEGRVLGRLIAYEDRPPRDDAWNVQVYHTEKFREIDDVQSVTVLEKGPVRGIIRVVRKFRSSTIQTDITVYAGSPILDFKYEIDWYENHYFIKAEHPTDVNTTRATYDIQFGYLERNVTTGTLWDFGRFECCAHKYADLSDNSHGLAIINDCKYGYSADKNSLNISLLKCATYPDPLQDQGHHTFSYALYAHEGDQIKAGVRKLAYDYNYPVYTASVGMQDGSLPSEYSFIKSDCDNVIIETVKKAEDSDDIIVRLYESENKSIDAVITTGFNFSSVTECDLMENDEEELHTSGNCVGLSLKPFEIKTLKIRV